jgi:aminoglycoside 3-N-acetyltransferase I
MRTKRLTVRDRELARRLFAEMAAVFAEEPQKLSDSYLDCLLNRVEFFAIAALVGDDIVGGLTAHTLPMTRSETSEVFIYDIAVRADHQRRGVGRHLITALRQEVGAAGIREVFVPVDNDDDHALKFYQALGGGASLVTFFTFSSREP